MNGATVRYTRRSVYVQAQVAFPPKRPSQDEICGGVGLALAEKIRLRRNLDDVRIFDSSADPPEQRWPRKQP